MRMRRHYSMVVMVLLNMLAGCSEDQDFVDNMETGLMQGRVFSIGSTAVTEDWSPPPLEGISRIIVLDENQKPVHEMITDRDGWFHISIEPGEYFLLVKAAPIQSTPYLAQPITGPFRISASQSDSAYAYFDNGLR